MKEVALAIIKNTKGEFLLQHKDKDAPNFPDTWCLFGGGIMEEERPEDAVIREIYEELGVKISEAKLLAKSSDERTQIIRYYCRVDLDVPVETLKAQLTEGDDVQYFALKDLNGLKINPAHHKAVIELGH